MRKLFLLPLLALLANCQTDSDIRPANYDELAAATGHWEWHSSAYDSGLRTPATVGYTRQLTFGPDGRLRLQANGQLTQTSYALSMGALTHCNDPAQVALVTFTANEAQLPNDHLKAYTITQQGTQQVLSLTGETACVDGGAYETYYWVAE